MDCVKVLKPTKYNVYIGNNITYRMLERFTFDKVMVIADDNLQDSEINNVLVAFPNSYLFKIKASEDNKSIKSCEAIINELIKNDFGKCDYILALGGGMICDLAGFVASTFKRGIKLILVPTSMLAMVDASVGGKVAINYANLKNMIGTIYAPEMVIIDPHYLKTLPIRHLNNGLMEAYKMGLTLDKTIIDAIHDKNYLEVIKKAISAKVSIVNEDPFDYNLRHVLNFGHTIGHALEMIDNTLLHGEAIAAGLSFFINNKDLKGQVINDLANYFDINKVIKLAKDNKELVLEKIKNDKKIVNSNHYVISEVVLNDINDYEFSDYRLDDYEVAINE